MAYSFERGGARTVRRQRQALSLNSEWPHFFPRKGTPTAIFVEIEYNKTNVLESSLQDSSTQMIALYQAINAVVYYTVTLFGEKLTPTKERQHVRE